MIQMFSENAGRIMELAASEARRLNHEHIGTQHLLLALIKTECSASLFLANLIELDILARVLEGWDLQPNEIVVGELYQTPRLKKIIRYASEKAKTLNRDCVNSACLLSGILREEEGLAADILSKLGLTFGSIRGRLQAFLMEQSSK